MSPRSNSSRRAVAALAMAVLVAACGGRRFPGETGPEATPPAPSPAQSPDVDLHAPGADPDAAEDAGAGAGAEGE